MSRVLDPAQAERLRLLLDNSRRLRELVSELGGLALRKVENDPAQPELASTTMQVNSLEGPTPHALCQEP